MALLLSIRINHHAETPKHNNYKKRHDKLGYSSICYIGSKIGWVSMTEVYKLDYRCRGDIGKFTQSVTIRYILTI